MTTGKHRFEYGKKYSFIDDKGEHISGIIEGIQYYPNYIQLKLNQDNGKGFYYAKLITRETNGEL